MSSMSGMSGITIDLSNEDEVPPVPPVPPVPQPSNVVQRINEHTRRRNERVRLFNASKNVAERREIMLKNLKKNKWLGHSRLETYSFETLQALTEQLTFQNANRYIKKDSHLVDECPICMESYLDNKLSISVLECNHHMCKSCLSTWMNSKAKQVTCALCRQVLNAAVTVPYTYYINKNKNKNI